MPTRDEQIAAAVADALTRVTVAEVKDVPNGVTVTFSDSITVYLGIDGKSHCPLHPRADLCDHHRAALPEWERHREELAQANRGIWSERMYRSIGLDPTKYLGE